MSARISPSTLTQPHDLSIYQSFADRGTAQDDDVILNIDKTSSTPLTSASTKTISQKLYRFFFGQKKSDIVQDFSAALEAKYGTDVASFAFSEDQKSQALNAGLSKSMIKQVIENASFARQAKDDIETYADMAGANIAIAQKVRPGIEMESLQKKFQNVQDFAGQSLTEFKDIPELEAALKEAVAVATTSKAFVEQVGKAWIREDFTMKLKSLETVAQSSQEAAATAAQEISSIKEKLIVDLKQIESAQQSGSSSPTFSSSSTTAQRQLERVEHQKLQQQIANTKCARVQLDAVAAMAPQQTILTEARCAEYLYRVTLSAHELATANKEVSAVTTNMVASAEHKVALAHTILAHATAAEEAAKKTVATPSAGVPEMIMASRIFYVAEQAKLMALSPNNAIETLSLKKELETIQTSLAQRATSAKLPSLRQIAEELHHDHATFLLAETRDLEEASAVAQRIARTLSQASLQMQESAANTEKEIPHAGSEHQEGLTSLLHQQQETATLLQQAASRYTMLSCCKEIETHRDFFHEELRTFSDLVPLNDTSAQAALADFTAIEDLVSKEEVSFPTLNIDHLEDLEQSANIIGLNGKITTSALDYTPTREDYKDGMNLVRLSIAQKFGIDAVTRFDGNFEAKIRAKNPLTVGELASFIAKEKSTGAAIYFITPATSLEALRDQLKDVVDDKIIRSDSRVDNFNPFEPPQERRALQAAPHTLAQNNQQGIEKALAVVLGTIETKEENKVEVDTITNLFKENIQTEAKKKKQEPMTVGELKTFLDEAIRLRSTSSYTTRHFKRYLRSEKAAESVSDAIAWHAAGLSSEAVLASAAGMMHVPEPIVFSLGILAYLTAVYLNRPVAASDTSSHH